MTSVAACLFCSRVLDPEAPACASCGIDTDPYQAHVAFLVRELIEASIKALQNGIPWTPGIYSYQKDALTPAWTHASTHVHSTHGLAVHFSFLALDDIYPLFPGDMATLVRDAVLNAAFGGDYDAYETFINEASRTDVVRAFRHTLENPAAWNLRPRKDAPFPGPPKPLAFKETA